MLNLLIKFSSENIVILLILLVVVVIITIIAFLVDNRNRKYDKLIINNTKQLIEATKEKELTEKLEIIKEEPVIEVKAVEVPKVEQVKIDEIDEMKEIEESDIKVNDEQVTVDHEIELTEQEKARQELERIEQELKNPKEEHVGPTDFEIEQEKTAIINYEELKKAASEVDTKDAKLLEDEGNEPISIEDLYRRDQLKKIEMIDFNTKEEPKEPIKFKNSEVVSPVFGVTKEEKNLVKDIKQLKDIKDVELKSAVELEIAKTERFLKELKELRNKLD